MYRYPANVPGSKYRSQKTVVDGITFDSKHEAQRYAELKLLERAGKITDLQLQRSFTLIGTQRDKDGKVIERPVTYKADFVYKDKTGAMVVEDTKAPPTRTKDYVIKRKLMLSIYGIRIKEV